MADNNDPTVTPEEDVVLEAETVDVDVEAADAGAADAADVAEDGGATEEDPRAALQLELDERTADLQRVTAEFANYRRRADRERTAARESAKASVATELLSLADDLDRAEQHGDLASDGPLKAFAGKFRGILDGIGVESFGAEGDTFDPEVHEAVQDLSSGGDQVVGTVLRKGYRLGDRNIRTAMVVITDAEGTGN